MADIYVDVGPMAHSKDPVKVPIKYIAKTTKLMRDGALKVIEVTSGFTTKKAAKGYHVDATLTEIVLGTHNGQPAVTCKVNGLVATYPDKKLLTGSLSGEATLVGGTSERDVYDCITAVMEATTKDEVLPFLRTKGKP